MTADEIRVARVSLAGIVAAIEEGELEAGDVQRAYLAGAVTALDALKCFR